MNFSRGKLDDLKRRLLWTLLLLFVYRMAAQVPVAGVNAAAIASYFNESGGGIFDLINTFSGGAFKRFSVLALGIMPYITTSIIFSLLGEVIPQIKELQEDADGYKKIQKMTRYFTVLLCIFQGLGMATVFENFKSVGGVPVIDDPGWFFRINTVVTLTAGTMFLLWLGERITEYGIENGVSLIVFAGIAVELPSEILRRLNMFRNGEITGIQILIFFGVILAAFYIVSYIERAYRAVPVQYAKKVVHNRVYGGTQNLPMRVDTGGVMPPILASSLMAAPATFASFMPQDARFGKFFEVIRDQLVPGKIIYGVLFAFLIIYMNYFYAPIGFKTKRISENLQKNNAFIPGVRPGVKTKEYLDYILYRLTFFSSIFLVVICLAPSAAIESTTRFGGTGLLILVSVAIRAMLNIQAMLYSDRYETAYKARGKYNGAGKKRF